MRTAFPLKYVHSMSIILVRPLNTTSFPSLSSKKRSIQSSAARRFILISMFSRYVMRATSFAFLARFALLGLSCSSHLMMSALASSYCSRSLRGSTQGMMTRCLGGRSFNTSALRRRIMHVRLRILCSLGRSRAPVYIQRPRHLRGRHQRHANLRKLGPRSSSIKFSSVHSSAGRLVSGVPVRMRIPGMSRANSCTARVR